MKKNYSLLPMAFSVTSIMFFILGCNRIDDNIHTEVNIEKSHVILLEKALSDLQHYTQTVTRSSSDNKIIKEVFVVGYSQTTKSTDTDTLLYAINFENEEGYAIMAADNRIAESLIMITDTGSVDRPDFYYKDDSMLDSIDFYDEDMDDYLIGGNPINSERYILNGILEYANYQRKTNSNTPTYDIDHNPYITAPIPGEDRPDTWVDFRNLVYETITDVEPLLNTRWRQDSPYNDMVVPHGDYAGCVPIAIAQIMAFNQYPQNYTINGVQIIWDQLTENSFISPGTAEAEMAAALVGFVYVGCHALPFGELGTFTFPYMAERFLKSIGYTDVIRVKKYDEDNIISNIENGYPVFMSGVDGIAIWNAHAWVADGVKREIKKYDMYDHASGKYLGEKTELAWNHIHCVWGSTSSWVADGYFRYQGELYDTFRVITYSVPKTKK